MYKSFLLLLALSPLSSNPHVIVAQTYAPNLRSAEKIPDGRISTDVNAEAKALYKTGLDLLDS